MKRNKLFENTAKRVNTFVIDIDKIGDEIREVDLGVGHTLDFHLFGKHYVIERRRRYVRVSKEVLTDIRDRINKILEEM